MVWEGYTATTIRCPPWTLRRLSYYRTIICLPQDGPCYQVFLCPNLLIQSFPPQQGPHERFRQQPLKSQGSQIPDLLNSFLYAPLSTLPCYQTKAWNKSSTMNMTNYLAHPQQACSGGAMLQILKDSLSPGQTIIPPSSRRTRTLTARSCSRNTSENLLIS